MLFEILCYTVAIVTVLAFFGSPATTATEAPTEAPTEPEDLFEAMPSLGDLLIEVEAARVESLTPAPAMAQTITEAVTLTIHTEAPATDYSTLKTPELRKLCSQRGITWRNALGANKHLSKAAMVAALA